MNNPWADYDPMDEEEPKQLLNQLKSLKPHESLSVEEAPGEWGDPGDIFEMAACWLARGEPVYFTSSCECWVSFFAAPDFELHYARSSDELEYARQMILNHKELVDNMLKGLDEAQSRLARSSKTTR
jgi:hypothetical protein